MRSNTTIIGLLVLNYMAFGGFLYLFQEVFLYHTTQQLSQHGLIETDLRINEDIILKLFVVNPGYDNAVLYFGGNAESVERNASYFGTSIARQTVYLINYRGYGGSMGKPSEAALYSDALQIYDELKQQHAQIAVIVVA